MAIGLLPKKNKEVNKVVLIPLSEIERNPNQPRKHFDPESIQDLSKSIIANGLLQPITVRRTETSGYQLIAGERRTRAFRLLGRDAIPAIVEDFSDEQSATLALIENLQRKDLNYFEEAAGIATLMEHLQLTQQEVSTRLGKAQSTVANKLRLLRIPMALQREMLDAGLSERHARALLRMLNHEKMPLAVHTVIEKEYNVGQTEEYVERLLNSDAKPKRTRLFVVKDMRMFHNSIKKACSMMNMAGIPVENITSETEDRIEYYISIPKSAVYEKPKEERAAVSAV